ncbi:MAG: hypothetical protein Q4G51_09230 [Dermatophilus congolensis]|nr:hypothetical protein [Dermatophilus congolensis]
MSPTTSQVLAEVAAAFRAAPERQLSDHQAREALLSAAESIAARGATEAATLLQCTAHELTTWEPAPAEGWTPATLAERIAPVVVPGTVVDLKAERARRDALQDDTDSASGDNDAPAFVDGRVVFHPASPGLPWKAAAPNRDVIPPWLRDPASAKAAAVWAAKHTGHVTAFHTVRLPVYWARLAAKAPLGAWRVVAGITRWTLDADGAPVRRALSAAADRTTYDLASAQTYVRLEEQRRSLVRTRLALTAAGITCTVVLTLAVAVALPLWKTVVLLAGVTALLGFVGRDISEPVLSRSVDTETSPKLTSDLILTALGSLGIAELNKALRTGTDGVRFPAPISRDGAGWRAEIDLPPGVTAGDVAERRDRLASGLRRPLSAVWPEPVHDVHTGRLALYVADKPMNKTKPVAWPLAARGTVNLFHPFPIGADPRGKTVTTELMFVSCVVGAMPRMGKTFSLRVVVLGAALDVRSELHVFDLKGGADWLPLENVAHAFRIGDDPDDLAYLVADLRALSADMNRRYKTLRTLGRDVCPEGKVTDALASDKRLGLHPVILVLDECQRAFEDATHGKEITALCEDIAKRGPAAAIVPMYATQRPDSASLPKSIASNAAWRLCFKVAGQVENDMVLGTSAYQGGTRATLFSRSEVGVGYLAGESDEPVIVRMAYLDAQAADKVAARARTARVAAGRLTGHAAGVELAHGAQCESILDHLAAIWPAGETRVWCDTLAERLTEAYPSAYAGWTAENVTNAVKPHGLSTRQIKRDGVNRRGLTLADLTDALDRLDQTGRPDDDSQTPEAG